MVEKKLSDRELLTKILKILEDGIPSPQTIKKRIYNNKELMKLLNIKDKYLKKLRDNGYLGYSREGDKYWYTQADVDRFMRRFHYEDFSKKSVLPSF